MPDGEGDFSRFITSGMSEKLIEAMGPLPRTHGLLGAMLESPEPYRIDDIHADPRFRGWWPRAHPDMRSFLGVPVVARGRVIGAVYLTEKLGGGSFTDDDERLIGLLAAHAAIAIENARLHERSRELSIVEERNRLARELHDNVTQRLFGVALAVESAETLLERDAGAAAEELGRVRELARGAMEELRAVVFELRPASLEAEGLPTVLRKHVDVLRRVSGRPIELQRGRPAAAAGARARREVFRIAQEALQNALRHAEAEHIEVRLEGNGNGTARAVGGRRRARLRPGAARGAGPPAGADLDGGARRGAGRDARDRLHGRRGDARAAGGGRVIRVLIADDHAVVRQGLRTFLDLQADIDVVGEAADGEEAVAVAAEHAPDVILLDLVMPRLDGIGALRRLRETVPAARVIVLTSFGEDERLFTALRAGASGYLLKDVEPAELVRSIRTVHTGGAPLSPAVAARVVEELASGGGAGRAAADDLTPRELEVLCLIARGLSNKRIALELGVAEKTVKTHVSHVLAKLGLSDRTQAALYAVREGLVSQGS